MNGNGRPSERDRDEDAARRTPPDVVFRWLLLSAAIVAIVAVALVGPCRRRADWLVALYFAGDDQLLSVGDLGEPRERVLWDFNEVERIGSSDRVTIVAQIDRYGPGAASEDDDAWTAARRYLVERDDDLFTIGSKRVADLGEVDMSDPTVLADFVRWAVGAYPAERVLLVIGGHGLGWRGVLNDATSTTGEPMSLHAFRDAVEEGLETTGIDRVDVLGFDACLMGQLEVLAAVEPLADVVVASECTTPDIGWGYEGFLKELTDDPAMDGRMLAEAIVAAFLHGDAWVIDEAWRVIDTLELYGAIEPDERSDVGRMDHDELVHLCGDRGIKYADVPNVTQRIAESVRKHAVLAAFDLSRLPAALESVGRLADALRVQTPSSLLATRAACHTIDETLCWSPTAPVNVDARVLLDALRGSAPLDDVVGDVGVALDRLILDVKRYGELDRFGGVSIYSPGSASNGLGEYRTLAEAFASRSGWADVLDAVFLGPGAP